MMRIENLIYLVGSPDDEPWGYESEWSSSYYRRTVRQVRLHKRGQGRPPAHEDKIDDDDDEDYINVIINVCFKALANHSLMVSQLWAKLNGVPPNRKICDRKSKLD